MKELSWTIAHHCYIPPSPCPRSEPLFSLAVQRYENRRKNGHYRFVSRMSAKKKSVRRERFNYRMWDLLSVCNRQSLAVTDFRCKSLVGYTRDLKTKYLSVTIRLTSCLMTILYARTRRKSFSFSHHYLSLFLISYIILLITSEITGVVDEW